MKKIMTIIGIIALLLVLLLAGLGVWAYYEFLYTEPLSEQELAELSPDWDVVTQGNWSPWYDAGDGTTVWNPAASYNAWVSSVPEEDKAWPILIEAYYDHMDSVFLNDLYTEHAGTLPEHPERWALYRALIETDEVGLLCQKLADASTRPVLGCELLSTTDPYEHAQMLEHGIEDDNWNSAGTASVGLMDVQVPWLGRLRAYTNVLNARAAYELEQGNPDAYIEYVETMHRLGSFGTEFPMLISSLVEIAINGVIHRSIDWALATHADGFVESQLGRLAAVLDAQDQVTIGWDGERLAFHDTVRRLCDENGGYSTTKFRNFQYSGAPCSLPLAALQPSPQRMLYVYQVSMRQGPLLSRIPWDEHVEPMMRVFEREQQSLDKFGELTLGILIPAIDSAAKTERMFHQQSLGTRLAVAAHRHRVRHGSFPAMIEKIDADLIDFNPIDAFNAQPLRYVLLDSGPLIYSVGDDRVDDGGLVRWEKKEVGELGDEMQIRVRAWPQWLSTQRAAEMRLNVPERIVGDWVLFPMPVNDPEPIVEREEDTYDG